MYMQKENKDSFVIVRVTKREKEYLHKLAKKAGKRFSHFVRINLGLEDDND